MNWDETVALFLQGREAWNAWADKMLAERKALEEAGRWAEEKNDFGDWEPENTETRAWTEKATADFFRCLFLVRGAESIKEKEDSGGDRPPVKLIQLEGDRIDLDGFLFPGDASFQSATFAGKARFDSAAFTGRAWFGSATFADSASFVRSVFKGDSHFDDTTFCKATWFDNATFSGNAKFSCTVFSGYASFNGGVFSGEAAFLSATFSSVTNFERVVFSGPAIFDNAAFSGNAWFVSATFSGYTSFGGAAFKNFTSFANAKFRNVARFAGIKIERAFDITGATFARVPAFNQADFKQPPDLDDVKFPLPVFWRGGKAGLVAQYRALRRMAIQGADYEREQMAFKGELRSRRWTVDKWWSAGTWIGLFYDGVADCGRSIVRPAGVWAASILLFAAFYWQRAAAGVEARCAEAGGAMVQALFLSVKNALVIFGGTRDARVNQAYLCLYNGSAEQPHIPPTVTFVETLAQIPVSATLIFLFLLAVKNRFKIK